ncbi:hypothetical protein M0R89_06825 [Halorussus limi]|uniref:Uncharacterized protein n=1 Tax=Halorussus limi TaxID=2938695 RepID=A0A8U0HXY4_9EURY|nr:hypothetical protein [Halorussus limi]UPV75767.1 hypothetical protein M0R89_06825 [Halorussus limi]
MSSGGSDETEDEGVVPAPVRKVVRTVTPSYRGRPDTEMTTIGIAYGLGLVVLLIPLLPFIVVVWVVSKITGFLARKAPTDRVR